MLDERAHPTEGGLEGREPIGGLFRNVEKDLRGIGDSLPLRWGIQTVKEFMRREALNKLTWIRISVTPSDPGVRQTSFLEHGLVWNGSWWADVIRNAKATRLGTSRYCVAVIVGLLSAQILLGREDDHPPTRPSHLTLNWHAVPIYNHLHTTPQYGNFP